VPVQKLIGYVGLSKQAAKGSGASSPATFGLGVLGGKIFALPLTQDYEDMTLNGGASDRFSPAIHRTDAQPGANFRTRAHNKSIGALLLGALGSDTVTGTGPYTHTIKPAQTLPYWTLFARYGSAEYEKLVDCVFDKLSIGWDERKPLEVEATLMGITPAFGAGGAWTATNDETVTGVYGPIGGTLQLDTGSAVPATAKIKAARVDISNNLTPVALSASILPDDLMPGKQIIEGSVTIVPDDFTDWRKIVSGSGTGTAIQASTQYGSLLLAVNMGASTELKLEAYRVVFEADYPESDPAGNQMELELAFRVVRPTDASAALTATVTNTVASY
jgi:hypothetical protein